MMALSLASSRSGIVPQFRVVFRQISHGFRGNHQSPNGQTCGSPMVFSRQFSRSNQVGRGEAKPDTGPVKFTESRAYQLGPQVMNTPNKEPWFQLPVIMVSMASTLIYFCVLRYCSYFITQICKCCCQGRERLGQCARRRAIRQGERS